MKVYMRKKIKEWLEEYTPSGWNWEGFKLFIIKRQWYLIIGLSVVLFFASAYLFYNLNMSKEISTKNNQTLEIGQSTPKEDISQLPVDEVTIEDPGEESVEEVSKEKKAEAIEIEIIPNETAQPTPKAPKVDPYEMIFPTIGKIHRPFAMDFLIKSETLGQWTVHRGVDIKGEIGVKVFAALDGIVESVNEKDPRWGKVILIDHGDGIKTLYASLNTIEVTEGMRVNKGSPIGTLGKSAPYELLEGPHLHFEVIIDGVNVNPEIFLKSP